jgi:hypothetical protein
MDQPSGPPQKSPLTKSFVILCSMAMVGGYMFYRSGGNILPSTKSARVSPMRVDEDAPATTASESAEPPPVMPGSKSAAVLGPKDVVKVQRPPSTQP